MRQVPPFVRSLGVTLIVGGIVIWHRAAQTENVYDRLGEGGSAAWALPLGVLMFVAGLVCLVAASFAKR